jgi:predicted TIM-barrel fold metal-dependent hydrolase
MATLESLTINVGRKNREITFLPDPEPRRREYTVVSVDDHLVEPKDVFTGRVPAKFADRAPKVIEDAKGAEVWEFDGRIIPMAGGNAVAGRPPSEYSMEPLRYDQMRRGAWDVDARVADMDLAGVWSSLCFPSMVAGFGGARFWEAKDPELGLASLKAWNDWHAEAWAGAYPDRFIPLGLTWLGDAEIAAAEVRRNAARGFHALSFPEMPEKLGLPSIHTGYWDPLLRACEETETVLCLHVGSASSIVGGSSDAPPDVTTALFFVGAIITTTDWLFSKATVRFPGLKIALSEGGVGWVPALQDRVEHCFRYKEFTGGWIGEELHPLEVLHRNFYFCALDDISGFQMLDRVGADRVMVECDYPHADSTWPDTQRYLHDQLGFLPPDTIAQLTWRTATDLYGLAIPDYVTSGAWHAEVTEPS